MSEQIGKRYACSPRTGFGTEESDSVGEGEALLVEGGRIAEICSAADMPDDIRRLDLSGCTLIPGLIDAHTHYTSMSGLLFFGAGVTTIRDTGNNLDWILEQRELNGKDVKHGPRIVCCGEALDAMEGIWRQVVKRHPDEGSLRESIRGKMWHEGWMPSSFTPV